MSCIAAFHIDRTHKPHNVRDHRAAANSLNIEARATRGAVCNPLLSRVLPVIKGDAR